MVKTTSTTYVSPEKKALIESPSPDPVTFSDLGLFIRETWGNWRFSEGEAVNAKHGFRIKWTFGIIDIRMEEPVPIRLPFWVKWKVHRAINFAKKRKVEAVMAKHIRTLNPYQSDGDQ